MANRAPSVAIDTTRVRGAVVLERGRHSALTMAATVEVIAVELPGEGLAWNKSHLIRLGGEGDLEWSTIVGGEVTLRTAKACVFCSGG